MPNNRVDQVSVPGVFRNHEERVKNLERYVGLWHYATPVPPATAPADYASGDPLNVPFQSGVGNVAGQIPFRYRIHPASKVEVEGALDLSSSSPVPVLVCTLPGPNLGFWPKAGPEPCEFPSTDGASIWTGLIDTLGNVWVTKQLTAGAGAGTITEITSTGDTVTITNPEGPITNLEVAAALPSWFQSGSGSPVGSVTPSQQGAVYQDTTNGAFYEAIGASSSDWILVGGNGDYTVAGVSVNAGDIFVQATGGGGTAAYLTDAVATSGSGNGLQWRATGTDGAQSLHVQTGAAGAYTGILQDDTGKMIPATTIDPSNFPTSDPADGGHSLWNDLGTIKVSS